MKKNYSIIIPHRNAPELLNRCLNSIPERSDVEIIVVDDNSDIDKKPTILRKDVNLICLDSSNSKGAGRARNRGLEVASGKWLLFPDGDDFYEDGFLEELDKYVDSNYDIVFFDMYCGIDMATGECLINRYSDFLKEYLKDPTSKYWEKSMKHARTEAWHQMYSHDFIKSIDAHYHELPSCNDAWFTQYSAINTSNITAIDKKLYYWVRNPKGLTNSKHPFDYYEKKEKELLLIKQLKAKEGAWNTIDTFWQGISGYAKKEGLWMTIRRILLRFSNGWIEWRIVWHKCIIKK